VTPKVERDRLIEPMPEVRHQHGKAGIDIARCVTGIRRPQQRRALELRIEQDLRLGFHQLDGVKIQTPVLWEQPIRPGTVHRGFPPSRFKQSEQVVRQWQAIDYHGRLS
jgi:hypothetical protein